MDGQNICGGGGGVTSSTAAPTTTPTPTTGTTDGPVDDGCSHVVSIVATDAAYHTTDLSIHMTPATDIQSWFVDLTFGAAVDSVQTPLADVTGSGMAWHLVSKSWDGGLAAGETLELRLTVQHLSAAVCPPVVGVAFSGTNICAGL